MHWQHYNSKLLQRTISHHRTQSLSPSTERTVLLLSSPRRSLAHCSLAELPSVFLRPVVNPDTVAAEFPTARPNASTTSTNASNLTPPAVRCRQNDEFRQNWNVRETLQKSPPLRSECPGRQHSRRESGRRLSCRLRQICHDPSGRSVSPVHYRKNEPRHLMYM